ncbi:hypothetical protein UlMin_030792 [Ulmus minor]
MPKAFFSKQFFFLYRILFRKPRGLRRNLSNVHASPQSKYHKYPSLSHRTDLSNLTLLFNVEGALLKSSSLFPYFMLVAFEAGGLFRSLLLFLLYPFICLLSQEMGLKVMVMICFFGIKKDSFRAGSAVLPKFLLEEVGLEIFEVVKRGKNTVGVSNLPQVMIETFLRDYLEIDVVVGREMKVFNGYFLGLMEEKKRDMRFVEEVLEEKDKDTASFDVIGVTDVDNFCDYHFFPHCKDVYLISSVDKRNWQKLPRDKYPKPLIFHDGRLAFRPTPFKALQTFIWGPFGLLLAISRSFVALSLPYHISIPILASTGLRLTVNKPKPGPISSPKQDKPRGLLYVCNHRTLLDPLYLAFALKNNLAALTYSLSRVSEILSPIKTVRLSRNRDRDSIKMDRLLRRGDLVVCPEGTTCREPYLLRFSPLFSEIADEIVPVAVGTHVGMFHGTTAGGLKCLDPLFFLMNPSPIYTVQILAKISGLSTCHDGKSRFDVANRVQSELGKALGYECTTLTRRDKYLILAGNEGISSTK